MSIYSDEYLMKCKAFNLKGIIPAVSVMKTDEFFIELKAISDKLIKEIGLEGFSSFLMEGQYLVQLWTAHFLLLNITNDKIKIASINMIKEYTNNPLTREVAKKENEWLKINFPNV